MMRIVYNDPHQINQQEDKNMFDHLTINPDTHVLLLVKLVGLDDRSGGFFRHPQPVFAHDYGISRFHLEQEIKSYKGWASPVEDVVARHIYDREYDGIKCHVLIQEFEEWYYFEVPIGRTLEFLKFSQYQGSQDWTIKPSTDQVSGLYVHPDEENDPEQRDWQAYIRFTTSYQPIKVAPFDYSKLSK